MELRTIEDAVVSFRVEGSPVPQPRQRSGAFMSKDGDGKPVAKSTTPYTPASHPVNVFKAGIKQKAKEAMGERPTTRLPLHVGITLILPRPMSLTREWGGIGRVPMIKKKGDNDNFEKAINDAMEDIVYGNDCQIYSNFTEVYFAAEGETPHAVVLIEPKEYIVSDDERPADGRKRKRKQDKPHGTEANGAALL